MLRTIGSPGMRYPRVASYLEHRKENILRYEWNFEIHYVFIIDKILIQRSIYF